MLFTTFWTEIPPRATKFCHKTGSLNTKWRRMSALTFRYIMNRSRTLNPDYYDRVLVHMDWMDCPGVGEWTILERLDGVTNRSRIKGRGLCWDGPHYTGIYNLGPVTEVYFWMQHVTITTNILWILKKNSLLQSYGNETKFWTCDKYAEILTIYDIIRGLQTKLNVSARYVIV